MYLLSSGTGKTSKAQRHGERRAAAGFECGAMLPARPLHLKLEGAMRGMYHFISVGFGAREHLK